MVTLNIYIRILETMVKLLHLGTWKQMRDVNFTAQACSRSIKTIQHQASCHCAQIMLFSEPVEYTMIWWNHLYHKNGNWGSESKEPAEHMHDPTELERQLMNWETREYLLVWVSFKSGGPLTSASLLDHINCSVGSCEVAGWEVFPASRHYPSIRPGKMDTVWLL